MIMYKLLNFWKCRKSPGNPDEKGRSVREKCFMRFALGQKPAKVAKELGVKEPNAVRYFQEWKRLGKKFTKQYAFVQELFKETTLDRHENIELFAKILGIETKQFEEILSQPDGLKGLMTGKFYFPMHAKLDHKRHIALQLAAMIYEHLMVEEGSCEDVYLAISRYVQVNRKNRKKEEADIERENKIPELVRLVLADDIEQEKKLRIQQDTLSDEEYNALLWFDLTHLTEETEEVYGLLKNILREMGFTPEQARQKIIRNLIDKGNLKGAERVRKFQDKLDPLTTDIQPPPSALQTPPQN